MTDQIDQMTGQNIFKMHLRPVIFFEFCLNLQFTIYFYNQVK